MSNNPPDLKRTRRQTSPQTLDRLPPHSLEAGRACLGCVMIDPQLCLPQLIEGLKSPEYFYDLRHQTIFTTMIDLWEDQEPIDIISLSERLKTFELLEQVGGLTFLSGLADEVPSVANLPNYIAIVRERYLMRSMIRVATETISELYDGEDKDIDELLDKVERDILKVNDQRSMNSTPPIRQLVTQALEDIETLQRSEGATTGIETGFVDLDRMTNGLQQGDMIVIAARPSMGKTSLAMNIAEFVSVERGIPVGVFSLEMTARSLTRRMVCSRARVSLRNVQDGYLADRDYPKITGAAGRIANAPLYIDDTGGLSVLQLRAKARRMWQQYGIKLFVIDYLQLLNALGGKRKVDNRQQEVADISTGIKNLAKELNVPVIVLSQLNRDLEKEKNRKPRLADLRESGAIEQDADLVGMLYKPARDDEEDEGYQEAIGINLLLAKARNGPTGDVNLTFIKSWTRFESAARVSDEDVPQEAQQTLVPA